MTVPPTLPPTMQPPVSPPVSPTGLAAVAPIAPEMTAVLAVLAAVTAAGGAVVVAVVRRRAARRQARAGQWWEITPPARPTAGAALAVWRAIGGALRRSRSCGGLLPRRLAVEFVATTPDPATGVGGLRVGVWLPPSMPGQTFAAALRAALPGAVISRAKARRPRASEPRGVSVVEVAPRAGVWAPLLDPATPPAAGASSGVGAGGPAGWSSQRSNDVEPLRVLFAALARRAAGERAMLQLVVRPARGTGRLAGAGGAGPVAAGLLGALARLAGTLAAELLDVFTPGPPTRPATAGRGSAANDPVRADPVRAAAVKARDAKRAAGPHLAVTLRVVVATSPGVPERVRRGMVVAIVGGYDLVATPLQHRWMRRPALALAARLPGRTFFATTAELAALAHLPADPARHGMTAPPARDVPPPPALPRLPGGGVGHAAR